VRIFLTFSAVISLVATTSAQDQEGKLVTRLLRPNMALASSEQNKQFGATGATIDKQAPVKNFYAPERPAPKSFTGERTFSPQQFGVRHFRTGNSTADISSRSQVTNRDTAYTAPAAPGTHTLAESDKTVPGRSYAGNRQFLDQGKSQKALSARNRPLTIEQVRELLNKNK
jgi:hypothetical protein